MIEYIIKNLKTGESFTHDVCKITKDGTIFYSIKSGRKTLVNLTYSSIISKIKNGFDFTNYEIQNEWKKITF